VHTWALIDFTRLSARKNDASTNGAPIAPVNEPLANLGQLISRHKLNSDQLCLFHYRQDSTHETTTQPHRNFGLFVHFRRDRLQRN
jgi:hypothetical protein